MLVVLSHLQFLRQAPLIVECTGFLITNRKGFVVVGLTLLVQAHCVCRETVMAERWLFGTSPIEPTASLLRLRLVVVPFFAIGR